MNLVDANKKMLSDPAIIGRGIWWTIHTQAKNATTDEKKKEFIDYMYMLAREFPCGTCRAHINEYIDTHSFDPFYHLQNEEGREIGMFKWTWMFHNTVNTRLKKPYLDWMTVCEMYNLKDEEIIPCTDCGSKNEIDKYDIVRSYFLKKK